MEPCNHSVGEYSTLKQNIIDFINKAFDEQISYESDIGRVIFDNNRIYLILVDTRLKVGENTRKALFAKPITDDMFIASKEKTIRVYNKTIERLYRFRDDDNRFQLPHPTKEKVIHTIKQEIPFIVDSFIEQVKKNNYYINNN